MREKKNIRKALFATSPCCGKMLTRAKVTEAEIACQECGKVYDVIIKAQKVIIIDRELFQESGLSKEEMLFAK